MARDGNAERVTFGYDSTGKVTITDAAGSARQLYFDHRGLVVKTEDTLGRPTYATFDNKFNLIRKTDETGQLATFTYDKLGNVSKTTDQLGNTTSFLSPSLLYLAKLGSLLFPKNMEIEDA